MATYKYRARDRTGKAEEGVVEAVSENELVTTLQGRGLMVINFKEVKASQVARAKAATTRHKMHGRVKLDDLISFANQLTVLLNAGITLLRSLEIITLQVESEQLLTAVEGIKKDVSTGESLKTAVAKHPKIFSKFWVNIIETGETTGQLPFALDQLTEYLQSSAALQRKIKGAMVYPCVIIFVASVAITVFVVRIIPMFADIYKGFGARLPAFTQGVFNVCLGIKSHFFFIIGTVVVIVLGLRYYSKTHDGRRRIDELSLNIFILGDVIRQLATVRFASGLNMLIKSGTPILHALDIVTETSGNVVIMEMLQNVKMSVREGKTMSAPLLQGGIFPDMLAHMVGVGEESGELANMLEHAGKFYEERVDATVERLATLIEPLLIVCVGGIVGVLVVAMFLPIFGLSSAIKA